MGKGGRLANIVFSVAVLGSVYIEEFMCCELFYCEL